MVFLAAIVVVGGFVWLAVNLLSLLGSNDAQPVLERIEAVSLLKPLRGSDPELERNLRTFFEQQYPAFEIVFGIEGEHDAALPVVERLRRQYPHVRARVVVHRGGLALNPKVRNLMAMTAHGCHDIVIVSDANVRVTPDYVARSVACLQQDGVGLVTHPIRGESKRGSMRGLLEASYLNSTVMAALRTAIQLGHPAVVGKSMVLRMSLLDTLGGWRSVADTLAEDYVLGRMVHHAGRRVVLCTQPITNVCSDATLQSTFDRMVRWSMLRSRLQPSTYLLEPLSSPLLMMVAALCVDHTGVLPWIIMFLWVGRDLLAGRALQSTLPVTHWVLAPARELCWLAAWVVGLFRRHVSWRGRRLRVSAGTRMYRIASVDDEPQSKKGPVLDRALWQD